MITPAGQLALGMLVGEPTLLNLARDVSVALAPIGEGGIIGGIAVFLHGYERTTVDIDAYTPDSRRAADALEKTGFVWNAAKRQHEKQGVPVHLITPDLLEFVPTHFQDIAGIRTVSLPDLLSMKLSSGHRSVRRARDLADVSELIQRLRLDKTMAPRIGRPWRNEFRRMVEAIERER